jgi:hypothetical protein
MITVDELFMEAVTTGLNKQAGAKSLAAAGGKKLGKAVAELALWSAGAAVGSKAVSAVLPKDKKSNGIVKSAKITKALIKGLKASKGPVMSGVGMGALIEVFDRIGKSGKRVSIPSARRE